MSSPNTNIDDILDKHAEYYIEQTMKFFQENGESPALSKNNPGDLKAKTQLEALIAAAKIEELESLSFTVVEPCEPECDEVRHALHEGSWNAHLKIEERIKERESYKEGQ